jgi:coenzyme F420-dependent glucose-6-phosphate dehydrogenase
MKIGYTLSTEEHPPQDLIDNAVAAERAGFDFLGISDHFHPWVSQQGHSPFSWSVLGALSQATREIEVFLEVVCPIMRYHPAIVAQAAATTAAMLEGRFYLGVGTGENLNEHIIGEGWPHIQVRQEMLEEAVEVIRQLWTGQKVNYYGQYFTVESARLYTLPENLPPVIVSAFGPSAVEMAGRIGDGLVAMDPSRETIQQYEEAGGAGKPKFAQVHTCYSEDKDQAKETAFKYWPNAGVKGELTQELRLPEYFEQATGMLDAAEATEKVVLGANPDDYLEMISQYTDAGYDHIYMHNIGPDQNRFLEFAEQELLPMLKSELSAPATEKKELAFRETLDTEDKV